MASGWPLRRAFGDRPEGGGPPGYHYDLIQPLVILDPDTAATMRLQGIDLHRTHLKPYRSWEW